MLKAQNLDSEKVQFLDVFQIQLMSEYGTSEIGTMPNTERTQNSNFRHNFASKIGTHNQNSLA